MKKEETKIGSTEMVERTRCFTGLCRENGLKVTPQRIAIYQELLKTNEHPSAETLYEKVREVFPSISLDTVHRTLLTLSEIGAATVVEGTGDAKRFDGDLDKHQHFRCVKCKRIVDFHYEPLDNLSIPAEIEGRFTVLRTTVYVEGLCDSCR
ncbi:MAG: Fur family transcriptional regulator [Planctomycetota bacterium]|jgi:Fur family peroxide stress response transcriptional regulator